MSTGKKTKKPTVSVIIPAINEGKILLKVINETLKIDKYKMDVMVIIDSKADAETVKVAKQSKARVINIGKGMGKGTAVRKSIPYIKGEYTVQIDADYQFMPYEIPKLLAYLEKGYDVALGTRYQKGAKIEANSVSYLRLLGSFGLSLITTVFIQKRITDVMAGFKAFKTPVLKDLNPQVNHFGYEAELVVRAAKRKYKIINVPIHYKRRVLGETNVSSIKHGLLVLDSIIKTAIE